MSIKGKLESTGFKYAIFSIDEASDPFRRLLMDAVFQQLGYAKPQYCTGKYKGVAENSWITTTQALDALTAHETNLLAEQESVLLVSECNKQYAELVYIRTDPLVRHALGSMVVVPADAITPDMDWTYRHDTKNFYVCRHENPDHESLADRQARQLWSVIDLFVEECAELGTCGPHVPAHLEALKELQRDQRPKWLD